MKLYFACLDFPNLIRMGTTEQGQLQQGGIEPRLPDYRSITLEIAVEFMIYK